MVQRVIDRKDAKGLCFCSWLSGVWVGLAVGAATIGDLWYPVFAGCLSTVWGAATVYFYRHLSFPLYGRDDEA